jgi:tRNA-Thr(GGU) m(6)t(6)A37 methyltransferase TsaA
VQPWRGLEPAGAGRSARGGTDLYDAGGRLGPEVAGKTFIEIEKRYQPALLGVDGLKTIQVLYWFDRNDSPEKRAILQVHPRGDPDRPLRGVFATRSPFRPNLIAISEVRVLAVRDNIIEIDAIDAFADTPVLDLKP